MRAGWAGILGELVLGVFLILSRNSDENKASCGAPLGVPTPSLSAISLLILVSVPTPLPPPPPHFPPPPFWLRLPGKLESNRYTLQKILNFPNFSRCQEGARETLQLQSRGWRETVPPPVSPPAGSSVMSGPVGNPPWRSDSYQPREMRR